MKKLICISFLAATALVAGCASRGHDFDSSKVSQIQKGKTTEADLVALLGEPTNRQNRNGQTTLVWMYSHTNGFGSTGAKSVTASLDSSGRVEDYTSSGN